LIRSRSCVIGPGRKPWSRAAAAPSDAVSPRAADLLGNRVDRRPLRGVLALVVQDHPNRPGTDLRGIGRNSLRHHSILSRVGASDKPGAVHYRPMASIPEG
jgi:hypothetical protein